MKNRLYLVRAGIVACLLVAVWGQPATAGPAPAPAMALTLSEAVAEAVANNPQISAARCALEASDHRIVQARAGLHPQVAVSETYNHTTNPMWAFGTKLNQGIIDRSDFDPDRLNDPEAVDNFATAVTLNWSLYNGGQTRSGIRQADARRTMAALTLQRARQQVIADAARAYVGLQLAEKHKGVVTQALETARAHLKTVESRYSSGFVVKSDLLRAQVRIAELEQHRLEADSGVQVAGAVLNAAMGLADARVVNPVTPLARCRATGGTAETWIAEALKNRPDFGRLGQREALLQQEVARQQGGHLPRLNLMGTYEINSEDFSETADNYALGAVVQVNLYSGKRISAGIRGAQADLRQLRAVRESMALGIRVQTRQAFLKARSAWQRIAVAGQAVDQASEGLRIVENRYKNGMLTIVSLLDAEVALQQAQTNHFKAMHDYKVARIELALAVGRIDAQDDNLL